MNRIFASNMYFFVVCFFKTLEDGDMALFDMGAEYHFYGSDVTCSFPVSMILFII